MSSIINFIFSKTPLFKLLNGKKTIIGALFIIVAAALQALEQMAPLFPQSPWIADAAKSLREVINSSEGILNTLGIGFLAAGVVHKASKAKLPPAE